MKNRYFSAALCFVVLNVAFILIQTIPLESTRLGDDSLAYLVKKVKLENQFSLQTPLMKGVMEIQSHQNPNETEETSRWKTRTFMKTRTSMSLVFDAWVWLVSKTNLTLKWTWFWIEVSVILFLAWAITTAQKTLLPTRFPEITMVAIALAVLPGQGLQFFIPGVTALAAFVLLLAFSFESKPVSFFKFSLTSFVLLGTHRMGVLYGAVIGLILLWRWYQTKNKGYFLLTLPLIVFVIFFAYIDYQLGNFVNVGGQGRFTKTFSEWELNCSEFYQQLKQCLHQNPHFLFLLILTGIGFAVGTIRSTFGNAKKAFLIALTMTLAGSLFFLVAYPAEMMIRVFMLLAILIFMLGGYVLFTIQDKKIRNVLLIIFFLCSVPSAKHKLVWAFDNINRRIFSVDERPYLEDLQKLADLDSSQLVFCETEIALFTHMMVRGEVDRVIPYTMLLGDPLLSELMSQVGKKYLIVPQPTWLNILSDLHLHTFRSRASGFPIDVLSTVRVHFKSVKRPSIRLTKGLYTVKNELGESASISAQEPLAHWYVVPISGKSFEIGGSDGRLTGVSAEEGNESVFWPWEQDVSLEYHTKFSHGRDPFRFDTRELIRATCGELESLVDFSRIKILSDRSGLLIYQL